MKKRGVMTTALMALAVVIAFGIFLGTRHPVVDATQAPSPLLGKTAPSFKASELGGGTWSLRQHRGDIVVVNFWASWCGPCKTEAPNLTTFAYQEKNKHVDVIGVVFNDTVSGATAFSKYYGSLYPSVVDASGDIANEYGVTSPPTTFVINAKGKVEATLLGAVSVAQLDAVVARVQS